MQFRRQHVCNPDEIATIQTLHSQIFSGLIVKKANGAGIDIGRFILLAEPGEKNTLNSESTAINHTPTSYLKTLLQASISAATTPPLAGAGKSS
jgi:hypothetical protein